MHISADGLPKRTPEYGREGVHVKRPDHDHVEGVYDRLKHRLLGKRLVPGQLLQIGPLADELGVSTTPVREALTRLAAERLIVSAPKKGFFAKTPTEEEIHGLYCVNQALLDTALTRWPKKTEEEAAPEIPAAPQRANDPQELTHLTGELFLQIAQRCGIGEIAQIVGSMNDRLHHPRLVESEVIDDLAQELAKLANLYAEGKRNELKIAVKTYHERRWRLVSSICKELLVRSFLSGKRDQQD